MTTSVNDGGPRTSGARLHLARPAPARAAPRHGRLEGPSRRLDRRINAIRDDLADVALAGTVIAPRYADGVYRHCVAAVATVHAAQDEDAVAVSQLIFGEVFIVFDVAGGWAWGQCLHDRYVGWVRLAGLADAPPALASHWIAVSAAPVFATPGIKARVLTTLPLNARLAATDADDTFVAAAGGFVHRRHVAPLTAPLADPVAVALGFVGTPYVWGGRTRAGIDCSGLTQAALRACGVFCPRDSDQQAAAFAVIDPADRRRGDLVVFPGHVGLLTDSATLLHATAHTMTTLTEPLATVAGRVAPTGFHRPPSVAATSC